MSIPVAPEGKTWDGHFPLVGLKVVKNFRRPTPEAIEQFRDRFVPDIADWLGVLYCVDHAIRPAYSPMPRMIGPAFTVRVPPGDNLMVKLAIHMAKPGDVIVIDARGHTDWCLGGAGMTVIAKQRGVAGMLIDGAYRDIGQVQSIDFPMMLRGVAPATGPKRGPGMINVPAHVGGVVIHPGDIIVGDAEGAVVIPRDAADRIAGMIKDTPLKEQAEDWDWDGIAQTDQPRVDYFNAILKARGCEFVESAD